MRSLWLVALAACGRVGFDAPGTSNGASPGSLAFGGQTWTVTSGSTLTGETVTVDARGTTWIARAPIAPDETADELVAVVDAIGTGTMQRISLEVATDPRGYACFAARFAFATLALQDATTTDGGATYQTQGTVSAGEAFVGTTLDLTLTHDATSVGCQLLAGGGSGSSGSSPPGGVSVSEIRIVVVDALVELQSFARR